MARKINDFSLITDLTNRVIVFGNTLLNKFEAILPSDFLNFLRISFYTKTEVDSRVASNFAGTVTSLTFDPGTPVSNIIYRAAAGAGTYTKFKRIKTGTITTTSGSAALVGVGTKFLTELAAGMQVNNSAGTLMGTVLSVTDDTHATFNANAAVVGAGVAFNGPILYLPTDSSVDFIFSTSTGFWTKSASTQDLTNYVTKPTLANSSFEAFTDSVYAFELADELGNWWARVTYYGETLVRTFVPKSILVSSLEDGKIDASKLAQSFVDTLLTTALFPGVTSETISDPNYSMIISVGGVDVAAFTLDGKFLPLLGYKDKSIPVGALEQAVQDKLSGTYYRDVSESLFSRFVPGDINGQNGWSTVGGSSIGVNAGNVVSLNAVYSGSNYAFCPRPFGKGSIKMLVDPTNKLFMLGFAAVYNTYGLHYAIYCQSGTTVKFGLVNGSTITDFASFTDATYFTDKTWVEVVYNGNTAGSIAEVRVWLRTQGRPTTATFTYTFTGSETAVNGNRVVLKTTAAATTAAQLYELTFNDDAQKLRNKALFTGYWFPVTQGTETFLCNVGSAGEITFTAAGTTQVSVDHYSLSAQTGNPPVYAISVDGHAFQRVLLSEGRATTQLIKGLDATKKYNIRIVVSLYQYKGWIDLAGTNLKDILLDTGAIIEPWGREKKVIRGNGDSMTAGVRVFGNAGITDSSQLTGSEYAAMHVLAQRLGMRASVRAFGGTGLFTNPSTTPANAQTTPLNTTIYAETYPMFNEEIPDVVISNIGENDANASTPATSSVFIAAYQSYIDQQKARYPQAKFIIINPRNTSTTFNTEISTVAANNSFQELKWANIWAAITKTDGQHPDVNGDAVAANYYYQNIKL